MNNKLKCIYEERAKIYNCSINTFIEAGITVLEVESMRGKNSLTLASFENHLFVRIDPEMKTPFNRKDISKSKPIEMISSISDAYASSEEWLRRPTAIIIT